MLKINTADTTVATTDSATTDSATTDSATTDSATTASESSASDATTDAAIVRFTTADRIEADCAKTFSTDSIFFCRFCAFKCKLYLLDKYYVDIFRTYENVIYNKCKMKEL